MFYDKQNDVSPSGGLNRHDIYYSKYGGSKKGSNKDVMAEACRRKLLELLKIDGNEVCSDCKRKDPEWASYNIGIFLCTQCAGIHRNLGSHVSKVKSLRLDNWDLDQVKFMEEMGNKKAAQKYEIYVPICYRRPSPDDVQVLKEQWVRAKYQREEFIYPDCQIYLHQTMEGWLWKRGKDGGRFQLRKFVLSQINNTLVYYVKENREPKAVIRVSELNATFSPNKIGNLNGMQLSYIKDGATRNIFLYSEDGKEIVDWYMAIRSAKLNHLQIAFPGINDEELIHRLTRDFTKEGWLWKTGPRTGNAYRKRWFTLDDRKLMYSEDPLDAFPKGEIFLGNISEGYAIKKGVPAGMKNQGFSFTLKTPERTYLLSAEAEDDQVEWITVIQQVLERALTPQDKTYKLILRKH
ncbi:arf-GAP with dual PH domain-containing protein 1-like [Centruroides vittatus]|uniref:arf-GAP with dual PH domain-containing protein 1-like n=1 Tax=Centruroides vittatus TaxID=120091 RepID=UPI00350FF179